MSRDPRVDPPLAATTSLFLLCAACAASPERPSVPLGPPPATVAAAESPVPRVDHHQHLMSPAMARHWSQPALPQVSLPEALRPLLERREAAFGDASALADLYTEDALFFDVAQGRNPLHRGREDVSRWVGVLFGSRYRFTPTQVEHDGRLGRLSGYLTRDVDGHSRHFAHVTLALRREADGAWRIAEETVVFPGPSLSPVTGETLLRLLDAAGIGRAVVLSVAYGAASSRGAAPDDESMVRAENDWLVSEARAHPDRLVPFCSVNPLSSYAIDEIERCSRMPNVRGIKLHFGNSDVQPLDPGHATRAREVFGAINRVGLAIAVHLSSYDRPYTVEEHRVFIETILPAASDVPIQIAHLTGWGGFSPAIDRGLQLYVDAQQAGDPRVRNLWFDATGVVHNLNFPRDGAERVAARIRELGVERVVFGADMPIGVTLPPRQAWAAFRGLLPLTDHEFAVIANNIAPYLR
jgi:uncharacterized protein